MYGTTQRVKDVTGGGLFFTKITEEENAFSVNDVRTALAALTR